MDAIRDPDFSGRVGAFGLFRDASDPATAHRSSAIAIKLCFSLEKQIAITELGPSYLEGRRDGVAKQTSSQWDWRPLIEKHAQGLLTVSTGCFAMQGCTSNAAD